MRSSGKPWTWHEDERVRELHATAPYSKLVRALPGRSLGAILQHGEEMGLRRRDRPKRHPGRLTYLRIAGEEAERVGVNLVHVLAGQRYGRSVLARWRTFRRLRETHGCSLPGIASVSGFDHTSVLHALRRLPELERASLSTIQKGD